MTKNLEILSELSEIGIESLTNIGFPLQVTPNFFQEFESELQERIKLDQILDPLPRTNPFTLPENYFQEFEQNIVTAIQISQYSKENVLDVPAGYFENLHDQILRNTKGNSVSEIQPLRKVSGSFSVFARAASILLIMGIGFMWMQKEVKPSVEQQLAILSDTEINTYVTAHPNEFAEDIYLENIDIQTVDINSLEKEVYGQMDLDNISSEELNNFTF